MRRPRENDKGDSRWGGSPLVFICNWGLEVFLQTQEVSAEAGTELVFAHAVVDFGDGVDGDGIYTDIQHLYLLLGDGQHGIALLVCLCGDLIIVDAPETRAASFG